jgi:hypothetical protein
MNGWRSLAILQKNAIIQSSLGKIGHLLRMMTAKSRLESFIRWTSGPSDISFKTASCS